jgi:hypothetical protein
LRIPAPPPPLPLSYPHSLVKTFQSHHVTGVVVVVIYVKEWPDLATTCVCVNKRKILFFFFFKFKKGKKSLTHRPCAMSAELLCISFDL